jgi:L-aspartate oxidase
LAPRDITARAVDNEMKTRGDEYVLLDCSKIDRHRMLEHFPTIYSKCLSEGIDCLKEPIPVVPAAHYTCGGIKVDMNGRSTLLNLYAVGECSCTGLHGANRLASNSLLEASVYAHRAAVDSIKLATNATVPNTIPDWNDEGLEYPEEMVLITQSLKEVQAIMSSYVGIVRSELRLRRAADRLDILYQETKDLYGKTKISVKLCELRNLITVAYLIIKMAMARKQSAGLHYMVDSKGKKK